MKILAIDPSGAFNEGKGETGYVITINNKIISFGSIKAWEYVSRADYWKAIADLITNNKPHVMVIEQYRVYSNQAATHINSEMETSKLLGYLEMKALENKIPVEFQMAVSVKTRFNDKILTHLGYIRRDNRGAYYLDAQHVPNHIVDALRHALFYDMKRRKKELKDAKEKKL